MTFVTRMSTKDTQKLKGKQEDIDINRAAKLVGVILGDALSRVDLGPSQAQGQERQTDTLGLRPLGGDKALIAVAHRADHRLKLRAAASI